MNFLTNIIEYKKKEVELQKADCGLGFAELQESCQKLPPVKSFISSLKNCKKQDEMALIAEVKKASPSKGLIREDFNPVNIAMSYEKAGAKAISVLTDEKFFQGNIQYLKDVKKAVKLPVLRKDFIIDPFQIYQTRLTGADMILLIASVLGFAELKEYYRISKELGLEILIEIHDKKEFNFALELGAELIGINNRNLETFEVSIDNTINLIKNTNLAGKFIISESGIKDHSDIINLKNYGVSGVLVGESLMRQENIEQAVLNLLGIF